MVGTTIKTLPFAMEAHLPGGTQEEYRAQWNAKQLNLRRFKLLGWILRAEIPDGTSGSSNECHIMKNYTELRDTIPGIGDEMSSVTKGDGLIASVGLFNQGGTQTPIALVHNLPEPIVFDRDDTLAIHIIFVNKASETVVFELNGSFIIEAID